jgi:protein O-mannosyl-transferase
MRYACALAIAAVAIASYGNSLNGPFVFDDETAIVSNPGIRSLDRVLTQERNRPASGRPVVALSFAANYRMGGLEVRGYHAANIAIHLCTALLLFGIARRTLLLDRFRERFRGRAALVACAIAVLWEVHPLATEAVDYVTQRTESLMALLFLLTLYAAIRALDRAARGRWQAVAIVASALGMASKETMVVAPVVVLLYDACFVFDGVRRAVRSRWQLYVGLAATWVVLAYLVASGPRAGSVGFSNGVGSWMYLLNQTRMIVRYLQLTVWPSGLVINYGRPVALTLVEVWPYGLAMCALLILTVVGWFRSPAVSFLGAWFFLTLAPSSSIVPIATEVGAERRMYLPLMALAVGAALLVDGLALRRRAISARSVTGALLLLVFAALAAGTIARNREYASALTLAQTTLARWPSPVAHGMVGGELAALHRDAEAVEELRAAAGTDPRARYNLGITRFNLDDYAGAIRELETFLREHPGREEAPLARRGVGSAYARQRNWPEAIHHYRGALAMMPGDPETIEMLRGALVNYGNMLGAAHRFGEAIAAFQDALAVDPSSAVARRGLAKSRFDNGDIPGALADAQLAIGADPSHAESYDLVARAFAMQGRYDEALAQLERARRLDPNDQQIQRDADAVLAARSTRSRQAVR